MNPSNPNPLTERELEIVRLLAQGLSDREIADMLVLAPGTVRWYNKRIYSKLYVSNRTHAVRQAQTLGLLPAPANRAIPPPADHKLPQPATPFIGRERELAQITGLIADEGTRLITLVGPGGMGKSRLALEVARAQLGNYLHGIYYIPLEKISAARHIVSTLAERLNYRLFTSQPKEQLLAYLSDKWLLLLFDGFEHLLEGADLIQDILSAAPGVKILVTSRQRLRLTGETIVNVGGLTFLADPGAGPDTAVDAIALFNASARRIKPDYAPDKDAQADIGRICQLVAGMPLAIILAASWLAVLPPASIRREIKRSIDFLQSDARDIPQRQQSIRRVFDYTWQKLKPTLRQTFLKLSIFRGSFSWEAAQAVTGAELVQMAALAGQAWLTHEPEIGRYHIHPLLRQYARERLAAEGGSAAALAAHQQYFLHYLRQQEANLKGSGQPAALAAIEQDFDNIRLAWQTAAAAGDGQALAAARDSLFWFCQMHGRVPDGTELLAQARQALGPALIERGLRPLLIRFDAAGTAYEKTLSQALACAQDDGDAKEIALLLWALGVNGYVGLTWDRADAQLRAALPLFQKAGDDFYTVEVLHLLAICARLRGKLDSASDYAQRGEELARASGNDIALARALGSQAVYLIFQGDLERGERATKEALALRRALGDMAGAATSQTVLGLAALLRGDVAGARRWQHQARDLATTIHHPNSRETARALQGWLASLEEDYDTGWRLSQAALAAAPDPNVTLSALVSLAYAACGRRDDQAARHYFDQAAPSFLAQAGPQALPILLPVAAIILARTGHQARAATLLAQANRATNTAGLLAWPLLQRLHSRLERDLGQARFSRAWEQGLIVSVEHVAQSILTGTFWP